MNSQRVKRDPKEEGQGPQKNEEPPSRFHGKTKAAPTVATLIKVCSALLSRLAPRGAPETLPTLRIGLPCEPRLESHLPLSGARLRRCFQGDDLERPGLQSPSSSSLVGKHCPGGCADFLELRFPRITMQTWRRGTHAQRERPLPKVFGVESEGCKNPLDLSTIGSKSPQFFEGGRRAGNRTPFASREDEPRDEQPLASRFNLGSPAADLF
ncbi:uncharacterized protein LOC116523429 [Thamnophis elegans]|uniref:uncharacterized protein LOC116523429 n=1 Tax=Thamnophis elegans TaxID=35005 RepID=UPI00137760C1|nr:uncharacterized protein LOC116523429 [Thamnophis elegans]